MTDNDIVIVLGGIILMVVGTVAALAYIGAIGVVH